MTRRIVAVWVVALMIAMMCVATVTRAQQRGERGEAGRPGDARPTLPAGKYVADDVSHVPPPPPSPEAKAKLRALVVDLRTEVDLLQLEHDATRANLLETMQGMEKADLLGIDLPGLLGTVKLEMGGLSGDANALKEMSDLFGKLEGDDPKEGLDALKKTVKQQKDEFRASLERKKKEFAGQARRLNEKKLDLAEAEKRYGDSE